MARPAEGQGSRRWRRQSDTITGEPVPAGGLDPAFVNVALPRDTRFGSWLRREQNRYRAEAGDGASAEGFRRRIVELAAERPDV
jgi:hypothetical protein